MVAMTNPIIQIAGGKITKISDLVISAPIRGNINSIIHAIINDILCCFLIGFIFNQALPLVYLKLRHN